LKTFKPGDLVILPNGYTGVVLREYPVGEMEILSARKDGTLYREYRYADELGEPPDTAAGVGFFPVPGITPYGKNNP